MSLNNQHINNSYHFHYACVCMLEHLINLAPGLKQSASFILKFTLVNLWLVFFLSNIHLAPVLVLNGFSGGRHQGLHITNTIKSLLDTRKVSNRDVCMADVHGCHHRDLWPISGPSGAEPSSFLSPHGRRFYPLDQCHWGMIHLSVTSEIKILWMLLLSPPPVFDCWCETAFLCL